MSTLRINQPEKSLVSSGTETSSANSSAEGDTNLVKRRTSNLASHRRVTSSNIDSATLHGITPVDAQALLEKE